MIEHTWELKRVEDKVYIMLNACVVDMTETEIERFIMDLQKAIS